MSKKVLHDGDDGVALIIRDAKAHKAKKGPGNAKVTSRLPVHVVYGGANLFQNGTPRKFGEIALRTLEAYVQSSADLQRMFDLGEHTDLVYSRVKAKLSMEPIEDFRIDFEDGYGSRPDNEEDADALRCSKELAAAFGSDSITAFSGFRVKSYSVETCKRARRTLNIFFEGFFEESRGNLPANFVVTLPKVTDKKEVAALSHDLKKIEKRAGLKDGSIKIEIMVEHPLALIDKRGVFALSGIVRAAGGRCVAAHFGAYDHTSELGIAGPHQDISHPSCDFARQVMLTTLTPLGVRVADSITPQIPVPIHRGDNLTRQQKVENQSAVAVALQVHFRNVIRSMSQGFFQSWDLHPNQLIARYAAVYSFFLGAADAQGSRLRSFMEKATKATLTGSSFDDAATAWGLVNFFRQGLDCGALTESELKEPTGLTAALIRKNTLAEIVGGQSD